MDYWFSAHEIAKLAAEMESKGAAFYRHLQGVTVDPKISEMCAFFAEQEHEHEHEATFLAIAEAHRASECRHCYSVDICDMLKASMLDLARLLDSEPSSARTMAFVSDGLALAARVEATAIRVYTKMVEGYTASFSGVLTAVLEEERKHLQIIQQVRERLQSPAALRDGGRTKEQP